jgi:hypothetical protein
MPLIPVIAIRGKYTCNDMSASVPLGLQAGTVFFLSIVIAGVIIPIKRHADDMT